MFNILVWIVFGALVGWIASILVGTNKEQGAVVNIIVGIVGSIFGGMLAHLIGIDIGSFFSFIGFVIAIMGSVALIGVVKLFSRT